MRCGDERETNKMDNAIMWDFSGFHQRNIFISSGRGVCPALVRRMSDSSDCGFAVMSGGFSRIRGRRFLVLQTAGAYALRRSALGFIRLSDYTCQPRDGVLMRGGLFRGFVRVLVFS